MFDLVYGQPVIEWVAARIVGFGPMEDNCTAIGFASEGRIIAGAVFSRYTGYDIHLSFAADSPRWATRGNIRAVFDYPFNQLGCARITTVTAKANKRARKLNEGMGFKMEGAHPKGWDGRKTAISYGLLKDDCKWLR